MNSLVTYIAARTKSKLAFLNNKHVTLAYAPVQVTDKLDVDSLSHLGAGVICKVEYWAHVDLTVALIVSTPVLETQKALEHGGFGYDHEFIPHITIGKGDSVQQHKIAEGYSVGLHSPYIQIRKGK